MLSKCPKNSFGLKISSNNDFTVCQNPGNRRLIIPLAAQFVSCVFLFLYPFLLSLTSLPVPEYLLPWVKGLVPIPLKLAKSLWRPLKQNQKGEMTVPSAIPHHSARSLPLGFLLHTNLITCLTALLWTACVPFPGLMGYSVPYCTAQEGMMTALLRKGVMNSKRAAPLNPDCCNIVTQHCLQQCFSPDDGCLSAVMKAPRFSLRTLKSFYSSSAFEIMCLHSTLRFLSAPR